MTGAEFRRVFAVPVLLAVVSLIGLLSALLGDGPWDAVSWIALGAMVVVAGWCWRSRDRSGPRSPR
jgi:hypothetical protein